MKYYHVSDLIDAGLCDSSSTIYRWIRNRDFPPGRLIGGNHRVWTEEEVEAWVNKHGKNGRRDAEAA